MRVLDLFAGTGSATHAFRQAGDEVTSVELDSYFDADYRDVLDLDVQAALGNMSFDFVWASPPCTSFSVGSFRHHYRAETDCLSCGERLLRLGGEKWSECCSVQRPLKPLSIVPKSQTGETGLKLVEATIELIERISPKFFIIENPRGLLRKMPLMQGFERRTVTYCQLGDDRMKPTDLWGVFPESLNLPLPCKNGAPCHVAAPRGAKTGTQGLSGARERSRVPHELSRIVREAIVAG